MSLTRFVLPGLMLGLVLSLVPSVAKAAPVSSVKFGNLGNAGTDDPSEFSPAYLINSAGTTAGSNVAMAQAFNTGAATFGTLKVNSITLSLFAAGTDRATAVAIMTGLTEPTTLVGASDNTTVTTNSGVPSLFTFSFSANPQDGLQLTANTQYWVVLGQNGVNWADSQITPTALNSSTYSYAATSRLNGLGNWVAASERDGLGISINAVPEPSTYVMAGIGAGLVGLAQIRRRRVR